MKTIYDRFAKKYDRVCASFERRFLSAWRAETLARMPENACVLEIGAGTGANFQFYPACKQAVATEISIEMLERARGKTEVIKLVQADAETLPFAENTFDAALATLVFCSIRNPSKAFAELRRVTKPNGQIVLLEHVRPDNWFGLVFDFLNVFTVALIEDHFNRRTAEIAAESGLTVLEINRKAFGIVNLIVCRMIK